MKRVVSAVIVCAALVACGPAPKSGSQYASSGASGAFGIVVVNGKQKMYLPMQQGCSSVTGGNGTIAVVDVGVAGNGIHGAPALMSTIDLGVPQVATTTAGDSNVIVAASSCSPDIWLINPNTESITHHFTLDSTYGQSSFSGGGGYVTGVAMDSANHRAILSVWNGFALLDTNSASITHVIEAAPAENFGFDSVAQRIIAPFYECSYSLGGSGTAPSTCRSYLAPDGVTVMTDGVNVIDLATNKVYTYEDPTAADPTFPVGAEPDAAAADSSNGVIVVPSESTYAENVIDLGHATFNSTNKTVTAPHHSVTASGEMTGVALETTRHLALFEIEFYSTRIAVGDVAGLNGGGSQYYEASMPNDPSAATWSNPADPHGIAVTTSVLDGQTVGFLVNSTETWVARIDLQKAISLQNGGAIADLSSAVTFLDPAHHE